MYFLLNLIFSLHAVYLVVQRFRDIVLGRYKDKDYYYHYYYYYYYYSPIPFLLLWLQREIILQSGHIMYRNNLKECMWLRTCCGFLNFARELQLCKHVRHTLFIIVQVTRQWVYYVKTTLEQHFSRMTNDEKAKWLITRVLHCQIMSLQLPLQKSDYHVSFCEQKLRNTVYHFEYHSVIHHANILQNGRTQPSGHPLPGVEV